MKNNNSTPYRNYGYEKITAPKNNDKNQPRVTRIAGKGDLRGGGKK